MPTNTRRSGSAEKADAYTVVTDRIIAALDEGIVPWQKPWDGTRGLPRSLQTGKPYQGLNVFMLELARMSNGYSSPWFVTFKQAKERGGSVKKGEKGWPVIFWRFIEKERGNPDAGHIPFLRYYTVFNADQCEGFEVPEISGGNDFSPIDRAEEIVKGMPNAPIIKHGGDRAVYSPALDVIGMPDAKDFVNAEGYYATLFHEMIHSTGHESRLNRDSISDCQPFGSETYSKEELVAEMGAAFLVSESGIEVNYSNSASYIASWLRQLKNDKKLIVSAASQAQKGADFILDRKKEGDN